MEEQPVLTPQNVLFSPLELGVIFSVLDQMVVRGTEQKAILLGIMQKIEMAIINSQQGMVEVKDDK